MRLGRFFALNPKLILIILSGIFYCSCSTPKPTEGFDILIYNANIIDGTGSDAFSADLLIRGDSIAFIGEVDEDEVEVGQKIDAQGKVVSPGFIDTHAHGNPVEDPDFANFLSMGVTTICLGQDGFSYGSENISPWISKIDSIGLGVNVITFIGHSTLRELSGTNYLPVPSQGQLNRMEEILQQGMEHGAFGLSTGLEYAPGYYAQASEMAALAKVVGEQGGLIMSHMRNEDDEQIEKSISELLLQGAFTPVHISHFKVVYGHGSERAFYLLSVLDSARKAGISVTADVYPYIASYTGVGIVFPDWAKAPNDYEKILKTRRRELKYYLHERITKRNGPDATLFGDGPWKGMTLASVADSLNIAFEDVLIDMIGPEGGSGAYFVMDEELQTTLLQDSLICVSSDGSPTMHHPRGYGTFAKIIRQYVNESGNLTLPDAIRKMTSMPASILGLKNRGIIKVGNKADILIYDPTKVVDKATYENPHLFAEGFDYVIINGNIAKSPEKIASSRYGRFLRKN